MIKIGLTDYTPTDKVLEIKGADGEVKAGYALGQKDVLRHTLMEEHYIEISFELNRYVPFLRADYIIWDEEKYSLREDYLPEEVNKRNYKYTLRFEAVEMFFQDIQYYYLSQGLKESEWRLTGNPEYFIKIAVDNINRYFGTEDFTVGTVELTEVKDISFATNTSTFDALTRVADEYEAEWFITGKTLHLLKKVSFADEIDFETEVSVLSMKRDDGGTEAKYTRIVALGSSRNIPRNYRETSPGEAVDAGYTKRLRIPLEKGDVIDAHENMLPDEIVEGTVIFDEIYPKRIGTIEAVNTIEYTDTDEETDDKTKWNAYKFKDSGIDFSEDYMLPGEELRIIFESGDLIGRDFALKFHKDGFSKTDDSQCFEIIRTDEYGKELPNDIIKPAAGDQYVLYGFDISLVSDQYVPDAEQELYDKACEWLQDQLTDKSIYECPTVIQYFKDNNMDLSIGQQVRLVSGQFKEGSRSSRIMGYEKKLINKFDAVYTVGDNPSYSRFGKIEDEIKELQHAGLFYESTGGKGVYLIKEFDATKATDFNAYSARRSRVEFLNKNLDGEVVKGLIRFIKELYIGENVIDSITAGAGTIIDEGRIQADTLQLRNSLIVQELVFNRLNAQQGDFSFSESGTIQMVEKLEDSTYRLTLRKRHAADFTEFDQHDIVFGIVNNLAAGDGSYYAFWGRVISRNQAANTITATLYPDDEVPGGKNYPPEPLMVIARRGNAVNEDRQGYWYISSYEKCICMLDGITKPILEEHNYSVLVGRLKHLKLFDNLPFNYRQSYVFCRGIAVQDIIRINYQGLPVRSENNRGKWSSLEAESNPYKSTTELYDSVYHVGCKWMCLSTGTVQEPKWNASDWAMIEGNSQLTLEFSSSNGMQFFSGKVDTVITPCVYWGYNDISGDILPGDWSWRRDSGLVTEDNAWAVSHANNGRLLHLSNEDMPGNWAATKKVKFTCTAYVRDGEYSNNVQNSINV